MKGGCDTVKPVSVPSDETVSLSRTAMRMMLAACSSGLHHLPAGCIACERAGQLDTQPREKIAALLIGRWWKPNMPAR